MTSKTSQAYRQIKILIEGGHLEAGQRLTEARVAEMVGISRGPVRESLLRLEAEGVLHHKGSRRSRVVAYTEDQNPADLLQRYELREQIESGAARLASKSMTGWQIDRLRQLAQQIADAKQTHDRQACHDAGAEFHQFLLANCGNTLFLDIWQAQRLAPTQPRSPELEDLIMANLPEDGDRQDSLVAVADAIAAHDPDRAEALMKRSVRRITEAIRRTLWKMDGDQSSPSPLGGPRT